MMQIASVGEGSLINKLCIVCCLKALSLELNCACVSDWYLVAGTPHHKMMIKLGFYLCYIIIVFKSLLVFRYVK